MKKTNPIAVRQIISFISIILAFPVSLLAVDQPIVGIARTLTDFTYVGYLADLAVRASHQRQGIGIELIRKTREKMGAYSMLVLLAAPKAADYYPKIGFTKHEGAWTLRANEPFPISHR